MQAATNDPNIADWLAAIGQVAGALAAAVAVGVAMWLARRDRRRLVQDRAEEARGQASMVAAEVQGEALAILNHSRAPIRQPTFVGVEVGDQPSVIYIPDGASLINNEAANPEYRAIVVNILAAGETALNHGNFFRRSSGGIASVSPTPGNSKVAFTIEFTDSDGRRWSRRGWDAPKLLAGPAPSHRELLRLGRYSIFSRTSTAPVPANESSHSRRE